METIEKKDKTIKKMEEEKTELQTTIETIEEQMNKMTNELNELRAYK